MTIMKNLSYLLLVLMISGCAQQLQNSSTETLCTRMIIVPDTNGGSQCDTIFTTFVCPPKLHDVVSGGINFLTDGEDGGAGPRFGGANNPNCVKMENNRLHLSGLFHIQVDCEKLPDAGAVTYMQHQWDGTTTLGDLKLIAKVFDLDTGQEVQPINYGGVKKHVSIAKRDFNDKTKMRTYDALHDATDDTFLIPKDKYTYVCLDTNGDGVTESVCAAVVNVSMSFPAMAGGNYSLVLFVADHFSGYHPHSPFSVFGLDYFCLCPQQATQVPFDQVRMVENHLEVMPKEGVEMSDEAVKSMKAYVEKNKKGRGAEILNNEIQSGQKRNASGDCCSNNYNDYAFFDCIDNSNCHTAKHTVIIKLPCVE